jgi:HPt (histidine-containing phosphotransfer) domain-containing protein
MSSTMDSETAPAGPVLDLEAALARLGNDRELFAEMAGFLLVDAPKLFEELRAAVDRQDASAVRMKAHALKGLVAGCGGVRATITAQALEDAGRTGNLRQASRLLPTLQTELNLLTQALANHRG